MSEATRLQNRIRLYLSAFITGVVLSGVTAFPLETELRWVTDTIDAIAPSLAASNSSVFAWLTNVRVALTDTNARYPFLAYGTDWLAFAHLVIAVVFVGPLRNPVRNVWVVQFGLIACAGVVP